VKEHIPASQLIPPPRNPNTTSHTRLHVNCMKIFASACIGMFPFSFLPADVCLFVGCLRLSLSYMDVCVCGLSLSYVAHAEHRAPALSL
jgi:hypothetical protein